VALVVHYRDAAATLRCLASLDAQSPRPQIVVVDNASPDGSGTVLASQLAERAQVDFVRAARNGGFGAGCNLGIAHALQRWPSLDDVLLLNPDAELAPGALLELHATRQRHPAAGIVGCRIADGDGRNWFDNGRIPRWTLRGFHCPAAATDEHRAEFVTGACMLLAGDLLRAGLRFDERYFLYCEDADLCEAVRDRGREVWITRRASARHIGGGSQPGERVLGEFTAERLYWLTRAKVLFARRRLSPLQRLSCLVVAAVVKPLAGLLVARSARFLGPYLRGLRDGLLVP
jgi:GT2 family glycosyltransferase